MPRLELPPRDQLSADQQAGYDAIADGPRGGVRGPLAIWLHRPGLAASAQALGRYCRYDSSLPGRLSELAILTLATLWHSEYEWFAHKPIALREGLAPDIVEALRSGSPPVFVQDDEAVIHAFLREMHATRRVSHALYARAVELLGEAGLVDLVGIAGYYTLISMTINVFEIGLPAGEVPELGDAPG